jgi:hypothetical protein
MRKYHTKTVDRIRIEMKAWTQFKCLSKFLKFIKKKKKSQLLRESPTLCRNNCIFVNIHAKEKKKQNKKSQRPAIPFCFLPPNMIILKSKATKRNGWSLWFFVLFFFSFAWIFTNIQLFLHNVGDSRKSCDFFFFLMNFKNLDRH